MSAWPLKPGSFARMIPFCSHHEYSVHDEQPLNGAACHGCLLISETSCEQHNVFLDRSLVLETVGYSGSEFWSSSRIHDLPLALSDRWEPPRGRRLSARECSLQECRGAKFSAPVGTPQTPFVNISALSTRMAFIEAYPRHRPGGS